MYSAIESGMGEAKGGNLALNWTLRQKLSGKTLPWVNCPSSPLPAILEHGDPWNWGLFPNPASFPALDYSACLGSNVGSHRIVHPPAPVMAKSYSGLMPEWHMQNGPTYVVGGPRKGKYGVRPREVTDGLSKTMAIVETSGVLLESDGRTRAGRSTTFFIQGSCCAGLGANGATTVSLPINELSIDAMNATGGQVPINSGHGGGAFAVFADASVHLLSDETDFQLLLALADRNDGNMVDNNAVP
jgi:hypothetical protein